VLQAGARGIEEGKEEEDWWNKGTTQNGRGKGHRIGIKEHFRILCV
jgi:hypothetical protein